MIMKRLGCDITLLLLSVAVLWSCLHVQYGYCSQKNDLQKEFQTTPDSVHQPDESRQNERRDEVLPQDPTNTIEHQSETVQISVDEQRTHETGPQEENKKDLQVDITSAESISDLNLESSILPEQDFILVSNLVSFTTATVTATQPVDFSTALVSSGSATCSSGEDSCSSASLSSDSPPAACDAAENQLYETNLNSPPVILENSSSTGTGRGTKSGLRKESQGNASSSTKKKGVTVETHPDSPPDKDAEDIPTFDEWKKIMMEEENEKSQSTHTSFTGATGAVKKVQKTTNYASVECGAKILSSNPEAKSTSAILMENVDVYMLNPCSNKIWFIIELCQPIQVKQLDIANFELFSSTPKDFLVSISDRYPTNKWSKLGTFHARDERTVQSFPLDEHLYAKYVKVELLSHFGSEHFCPLSLIRIFGTSMMEEYELNSEPSERLAIQDYDDDYPPGYVPSDDNTSKDIIVSAKDAIFNMVTNIAANVLGGNPEDGIHSEGNSSSPDINLTESSGAPVQTIQPTLESSNIMMESSKVDEKITTTDTQSTATSQTISLATTSFSEDLSATSAATILTLSPTPTVEEQIVTLLPEEEELDELEPLSEHSHFKSQEEKKGEMAEHEQLFSRIQENMNCGGHTSSSCSLSLKEYLLQICISLSKEIGVTKSLEFHETPSIVLVETSSLKEQVIHTKTMEPSSQSSVMASVSPSEHRSEDASLELLPSLTSTLTFSPTDAFTSKATQAVDFLAPSVQDLDATSPELSKEDAAGTPLLMPHVDVTSYPELTTKTDEPKSGFTKRPPTEEKTLSPSATSSTMHQVSVTPLTTLTDPLIVQPSESETAAPAVTEPFIVIAPESRSEDLQDAALGGFGSSLQSGTSGNEQPAQPSSSEFYAEMQSSTETPISGSNQKESVFMRLNNRIKALEVNMSLSGRYLEQLSQRYRKQMEEMQKAFNKTIIKLQNTSKMAEEQDQRQTESIQLLQRQLENMTQLVLNLSVQVNQLQNEVSDRYSYLLLCVILCLLVSFIVRTKFCRLSSEIPSAEQDTSSPNSYSHCSTDGRPAGFQSSSGYEELSAVRRASYPFSQSSLQIAPVKDLTKTCNAKTAKNSSGNKKKKRCKMKSSGKAEMMAPTAPSLSSVPNGGLASNTHPSHKSDFNFSYPEPEPHNSAFNFRDVSSEESSEESSLSDEPSFCGIATCGRLCEPLPSHKIRLKKRGRLKKKGTVLEQLLQPAKHKDLQVTTDFTGHGFILSPTELKTNKTGVLPLNVKNNCFD